MANLLNNSQVSGSTLWKGAASLSLEDTKNRFAQLRWILAQLPTSWEPDSLASLFRGWTFEEGVVEGRNYAKEHLLKMIDDEISQERPRLPALHALFQAYPELPLRKPREELLRRLKPSLRQLPPAVCIARQFLIRPSDPDLSVVQAHMRLLDQIGEKETLNEAETLLRKACGRESFISIDDKVWIEYKLVLHMTPPTCYWELEHIDERNGDFTRYISPRRPNKTQF